MNGLDLAIIAVFIIGFLAYYHIRKQEKAQLKKWQEEFMGKKHD